ncbi:hypothetical protein CDAR_257141 [Caerostris darwini]|uniref:Uncharacterized protein n=1 Tax=Caerostris darwini TaxID=1538125 RepID=A0AAV4Q031_9ARAC|nr:hypothetical protein CDAR_257141 [Caerostris darwini]
MGKFGKMMSRLFRRRSGKKTPAYVQEDFADFEANQDKCVLNPWQLPLVVHRFDAAQDRWVTCSVTIPWCLPSLLGRWGWGARNEGSPPPRGVPWATPWLKVRAAERLPT